MTSQEETKQQKHNDDLFISLREYVDLRFMESQRAIDKAEKILSIRLDLMNEVRGSLSDAQKTFLTIDKFDMVHQRVVDDIKELQKCGSSLITRREFDEHLQSYAIMKTDVDTAKGKASTAQVYFGWLLAGVSLILGVIQLFGK